MTTIRDEFGRRSRQIRTIRRRGGLRGLAAKALTAAARKLQTPQLLTGVRDDDILDADVGSGVVHATLPPTSGPLTINWVMTAPHERSGGHTTAFRLIRHLQAQGHRCRIYLYDVYGGDHDYHRSIVQHSFADTATEVFDVFGGMADAHAIFATSWETAYPVFNSGAAGRRFYLVQDYEPWFYPFGSTATLAENTYRMGFHGITAGTWLPRILAERFDMAADGFRFGCDTDVYRLGTAPRTGVVFYARPFAPRRAFELGVLALELFHRQHPDITIHFYGERVGQMPFPFVDHGTISPAALNDIYNECFAGLSLSMTNVSLVPHEMLAAGCIPVVNEAEHNRIVLDNEFVEYAPAFPHDLATVLSRVVKMHDFGDVAARASASVATSSWTDAGSLVDGVLRRELAPTDWSVGGWDGAAVGPGVVGPHVARQPAVE